MAGDALRRRWLGMANKAAASDPLDGWIILKEAARLSGVSPSSLTRRCAEGGDLAPFAMRSFRRVFLPAAVVSTLAPLQRGRPRRQPPEDGDPHG